jgi:hypothetical protein
LDVAALNVTEFLQSLPEGSEQVRATRRLRSQPANSSDPDYLLTLGGERCGKDSHRGVEERSTLHYSTT